MRRNQNREQADLWVRQARYDLKAARDSLKAGNFEWACFQAQQGAEKALIAYLTTSQASGRCCRTPWRRCWSGVRD